MKKFDDRTLIVFLDDYNALNRLLNLFKKQLIYQFIIKLGVDKMPFMHYKPFDEQKISHRY